MRVCEYGEDKILRLIFEGFGIECGFYADLGSGGPYSNTAWLKAKGWTGLEFDRSGEHRAITAHLTAENICGWLGTRTIDFLSVDLDGNDHAILKSILEGGHRPRVVIVEYNWGKTAVDDIQPYDPTYVWPGGPGFGCSWQALNALCEKFGYVLVFKNMVNAIFVLQTMPMNVGIIKRSDL